MNKLVLLFILLITVGHAISQENLKIKKVKFKGNSAFNTLKLKEQITLETSSFFKEKLFKKEASLFSQSLIKDDIRRLQIFYQKEGYLNVSIHKPNIKVKKNKVYLTFDINEGDPILVESVNFQIDSVHTINEALPPRELKNLRLRSKLRINNVFKDQWCIADQQLITTQFNNIGYAFTMVDYSLIVDTVASTVKINWNINQGNITKFGQTFISGNERVPTKRISRQLTFEKGEIWSKKELDKTQKRIYDLGMFRVSSVNTLIKDKAIDTLPIQINLKEAPRWTTRFGVGYGREDRFRVFGEIQKLGIITKIGRVNFFTKHSALEPYNFNFKFTQPAIFFPINSLIINPYVQLVNEPGYTAHKNGFNFTFVQNFSDHFNTNINFFFEDIQQDTTNITVGRVNELPESVYLKSGISLGFTFYNGEPKLDPVNGFSLSFNIKNNGILVTREMPFNRSLIEYKKYWGVDYGLTMAFKGKIGLAYATNGSEYIPPEERFYAGGAHSVRGWSRADLGPKDSNGKPIGGKSLMEGSVEARINLAPQLVLASFIDAGNVWEPSFQYRFNDLGYAVGAGLRYNTPIGPAGLDFARPIFNEKKTWQIHFNIGHPF